MFSGKPSAFTVKGGSMPMNHASTPVPMMVPAASTAEKDIGDGLPRRFSQGGERERPAQGDGGRSLAGLIGGCGGRRQNRLNRLGRSWCLGLPAIEPREMGGFVAATDQLQEAVFEFFAGGDLVHRAGRAYDRR